MRSARPRAAAPDAARATGVLTFHRCINYGSYWQARCLVEGLAARGHDAELLDHDSWRVDAAEWRCALRPVPDAPARRDDYLRYAAKLLRFRRAVAALPRSPRFRLNEPEGMPAYRTVVVGSDEVWNLWHPWYGGQALFFGQGVRARRLVSYAASCGSYDASQGLEPRWAERLRRFDAVSVRDENSRALVERALGQTPALVLDPCLQFPPRPVRLRRTPARPYLAVYGHGFGPRFVEQVRRWARQRGCRLVSIGYRNDWADEQWISAGPLEFAGLMARAEAVATNFFHGCVFALLNARPFVCETMPYRFIKVWNLMRTVGGEQHLVRDETPDRLFDARLGEPLDPAILDRIADLRLASDGYLDQALGSGAAPTVAPLTARLVA